MNRTDLRKYIKQAVASSGSYQSAYEYEPLASAFGGATPMLVVAAVSSDRDESQSSIRTTVLRHTVTATIFVAFDPEQTATVADAEEVLDDRVRAALAVLAGNIDLVVATSERLQVTDVAYRAERITIYHEETL